MLKRIITLFLLAGILQFPATVTADYNGPGKGGGGKSDIANLRVHNGVDDAVEVDLGFQSVVMEPGETRTFYYSLSSQKTTVEITARLVSDSSISATASVLLEKSRITDMSLIFSDGTLSIESGRPSRQGTSKK